LGGSVTSSIGTKPVSLNITQCFKIFKNTLSGDRGMRQGYRLAVNSQSIDWDCKANAQARVVELSVALENLQAYNNSLHVEVHVLYDQLHPNVPPKVVAMGAGTSGAAGGGSYGGLDLFGAPPSMNLADDRSPEVGSGAGAARDEDN
jgi:hypothetical protein